MERPPEYGRMIDADPKEERVDIELDPDANMTGRAGAVPAREREFEEHDLAPRPPSATRTEETAVRRTEVPHIATGVHRPAATEATASQEKRPTAIGAALGDAARNIGSLKGGVAKRPELKRRSLLSRIFGKRSEE